MTHTPREDRDPQERDDPPHLEATPPPQPSGPDFVADESQRWQPPASTTPAYSSRLGRAPADVSASWAPPPPPLPSDPAWPAPTVDPAALPNAPSRGVQPPKDVEHPHPLTGIARSWIALVGFVIFFGRDVLERGLSSLTDMGPSRWIFLAIVVAVIVVNLIWGLVEWRTTTFVADDEEFRIERNFLSRDSSRIAYTKIQSVDIERSLPARALGLSSVKIDVGGAGGKKLEFLGKQRAEVLRDQLLARMRRQSAPSETPALANPVDATNAAPAHVPHGWNSGDAPGAVTPAPPRAHNVVAVQPATLLKGVFVSSFLPWLVAGLVLLGVMFTVGPGFSIAAIGGVIFGIGGYLWSQIVNNWNFRLDRVPNGLHMTRGLFTTTSQSLKADRIQAVSIHQDYLQRLTGLYRVRVTVLGLSVGENAQTSGTVLPYGTRDDVTRVLAAFWPGIDLGAIPLHSQPTRARWLTPLGFRRHQWGYDDQSVVAHHGWLDHTTTVVPHRRMQSLAITQGPWQRRLGLARVFLHTTDGPVSLNLYHLDVSDARRFFDEQRRRARLARNTPGEPGYLSTFAPPSVEGLVPGP